MRKGILSVTLILNGKELNDDYWFIRLPLLGIRKSQGTIINKIKWQGI